MILKNRPEDNMVNKSIYYMLNINLQQEWLYEYC